MRSTNRATATPFGLVVTLAVAVAACGGSPGSDETERIPIDVAALGPQVGEQVPDFRLPDQRGDVRTLESVLGPRGALILFHRSADW